MRLAIAGLMVAGLSAGAPGAAGGEPRGHRARARAAEVIVVARAGADLGRLEGLARHAVGARFHHVFHGFSARLGPAGRARLAADPDVVAVLGSARHRAGHIEGFLLGGGVIDTGVRRVGALASPTAAIDSYDGGGVDADIAVLDSGIPAGNTDLNVAGGVDCTGSGTWEDTVGHGTFVAGLAAARDDGAGVVGVAPGARLWSVKVMAADETVSDAAYLCGLEWVLANAAMLDVVNLSLGGPGSDADCGAWASDALALEHAAICAVVAAGVTAVASAGNSGADASGNNPGGFPEVITVSAFSDTDGLPGGAGPPPACHPGADDTRADFSDWGAAVDITAPGTCLASTWLGGSYAVASGTSAAAPLVSGAAALVRAVHPTWTVEEVRHFLLATATPGPVPGDVDGYPEPILNVTGY